MRKKELLPLLGLVAWVAGCGLVFVQLGRVYNLERKTGEIAVQAQQARLLAEETKRALQELQAEVAALRRPAPITATEEPLVLFPVYDDSANEELRAEIDRIVRGLTWEGRNERR